jgi:hypothetical protein
VHCCITFSYRLTKRLDLLELKEGILIGATKNSIVSVDNIGVLIYYIFKIAGLFINLSPTKSVHYTLF